MHYNLYKNGEKVGETHDKKHVFEGLTPNTEYEFGVSAVENETESEIVTKKVTTAELEATPTNESDISNYHVGAGWYELPNGERVRGKEVAEEELKKIDE